MAHVDVLGPVVVCRTLGELNAGTVVITDRQVLFGWLPELGQQSLNSNGLFRRLRRGHVSSFCYGRVIRCKTVLSSVAVIIAPFEQRRWSPR